ncbi:MAG: hypothetical protein IPO22_23195 [Anaerolineales bacterium]|nr:hypothetical protein [Anaerolineales bacterium]
MWETITGKEIYHVTPNSTINALAISPDGNYLIIAGCNRPDTISHCKKGSVIILDSTTGKEVAHVVHDGIVTAVAISLDSKYVVSGSSDNTARVSSIATGEEVSHINHDSVVNTVSFSPDGKYVVSGSNDLVVRVWEVTTGREFARITHLDSISIARFSPDNKLIASGSADGIIQVWSWDSEELIAKTCLRVSRNLTRIEWKQYINDALPYQAICPNLSLDIEYITVIAQDSLSNTNDVHRIEIALNKAQTELLKIKTINDSFAESIIIVRKAISQYVISEVSAGRIKSALELLEQADQSNISIDDKYALNAICWFGSLNGFERDVLEYCDANVNLNPSTGNYYDSRGLARALTGDYQGAILDFQYYVDDNSADSVLIEQRKQWIEQLKKGINPFTSDVLESLNSQ